MQVINMKKSTIISLVIVVGVWAAVALLTFLPDKKSSDTERRNLAQAPEITSESLLNGTFMSGFETYTQDQFPMRDAFRSLKSIVVLDVLRQNENNGLYIAQGQIAKLDYPVNESSVEYAISRLLNVFNLYFADTDSRVYLSIVPDKGYYIADKNGYPAMDYQQLISMMREGLPMAQYIDLTSALNAESFYVTDPHCKQDAFVNAAQTLADAMGVGQNFSGEFEKLTAASDFYGAYYGQLALPMPSEPMYYLTNDVLKSCTTWNLETEVSGGLYDFEKLEGKDPYEFFLSGSAAFMTIENPANPNGGELVVFRDSYGSSVIPLLSECYSKITVVDLRYINPIALGYYIESTDADVLFLYSALLLNYSFSIR